MKYQWLIIPLLAVSLVSEAQVRPGPYNPGNGVGGGGRNEPPRGGGPGGGGRDNWPGPGRPVPNDPPRRPEPPRNEPPRRPDTPHRPEPGRPGHPGRPEPRPPRRDYPNYPPRRPEPPRYPAPYPEPPRYPNPPRDGGGYYGGQATVYFNYITRRSGGEWVRVNFYSPVQVRYIEAQINRAGLRIHDAVAVTYRGDRFTLRQLSNTGTYYAPTTLTSENFNSNDQIIAIDLRVESMGGEADMAVTVHSYDRDISIYPSRN